MSYAIIGFALDSRQTFRIPLAKLNLSYNEYGTKVEKVRISYAGNDDFWVLTKTDDYYQENKRRHTRKHVHREPASKAFIISEFEAEQLSEVLKTFMQTLSIFEKDLKAGRWDKCRYLDGYLPRFLNGFYYLTCAARNSNNALPRYSQIPDSVYDVSENSPKSDKRINFWRSDREYVIQLRIITRELIHQAKIWQKKELTNRRRNIHVAYSDKFEQAYGLFIRMYFCMKPKPKIPLAESDL
ncbi:MAG: hypothetical protein GF398_08435 [Chitinivibrionales bacterium]|nr:hypothetical protein [Chitinivibrionales bacterium]